MRLSDIGEEKFRHDYLMMPKVWPEGLREFLSKFEYSFEISQEKQGGHDRSLVLTIEGTTGRNFGTWENLQEWIIKIMRRLDASAIDKVRTSESATRTFSNTFEPDV